MLEKNNLSQKEPQLVSKQHSEWQHQRKHVLTVSKHPSIKYIKASFSK